MRLIWRLGQAKARIEDECGSFIGSPASPVGRLGDTSDEREEDFLSFCLCIISPWLSTAIRLSLSQGDGGRGWGGGGGG